MNTSVGKSRSAGLYRAALAIMALVAYLPSFNGAFIFDDYARIIECHDIRSLSTLGPLMLWTNRPVIFFTLWLNYQIGGLNVFGYHVWNFAVHLAAGMILFGLIRRTLRLPSLGGRFDQSADMLGFAVTLLWLLHPLQTQAVTYIIQRCESMMGMFYLFCLYSVLRASQSKRPWPWYVAGIAAGWLGMGCKEVMVTAPIVILLYDRVFLSSSWKDVLRRRGAFCAAMLPAILWVVTVLAIRETPRNETDGLRAVTTPLEYFCSEPRVILHYLRLAILPDKLCFDYQWPVIEHWSEVVLPGMAVVSLFLASLAALYYRPPVGFLAFSFFVVLAPTSSLQPIDDLAVEHRLYLPLALILMLIVLGFVAVIRRVAPIRRQQVAIYAVMLLLAVAVYATRTFVRNCMYSKPAAIWANVLAHAPNNARAYNNFGYHLSIAGQWEEAIRCYRRAIELDPQLDMAYCNLARALWRQGNRDGAIEALRARARVSDASAMIHNTLANLLENQGKLAEAIAENRRALELSPDYGFAHYQLGRCLARQGKLADAIQHFRSALEKRPFDVNGSFRLALACQKLGQFPEAIRLYRRTIDLAAEQAAETETARQTADKAQRNLELCRAGKREGLPLSDEVDGKKK